MSTKKKKDTLVPINFRLTSSQKREVAGIASDLGVSTSALLHSWITRILNNMNGFGDHDQLLRDK
jgi:hypothetical protein